MKVPLTVDGKVYTVEFGARPTPQDLKEAADHIRAGRPKGNPALAFAEGLRRTVGTGQKDNLGSQLLQAVAPAPRVRPSGRPIADYLGQQQADRDHEARALEIRRRYNRQRAIEETVRAANAIPPPSQVGPGTAQEMQYASDAQGLTPEQRGLGLARAKAEAGHDPLERAMQGMGLDLLYGKGQQRALGSVALQALIPFMGLSGSEATQPATDLILGPGGHTRSAGRTLEEALGTAAGVPETSGQLALGAVGVPLLGKAFGPLAGLVTRQGTDAALERAAESMARVGMSPAERNLAGAIARGRSFGLSGEDLLRHVRPELSARALEQHTQVPGAKLSGGTLSTQKAPAGALFADAAGNPLTGPETPQAGAQGPEAANAEPPETQDLYRETSPDQLEFDDYRNPGTYWTTNPDLALGQGKNKGVIVQFRVQKGVNRLKVNPKPGMEATGSQELIHMGANSDKQRMLGDLISITVRKDAKLTPIMKARLAVFSKEGNPNRQLVKELLPSGDTKYTAVQPTAPSEPPSVAPVESPVSGAVQDFAKKTGGSAEAFQDGTHLITTGSGAKIVIRTKSGIHASPETARLAGHTTESAASLGEKGAAAMYQPGSGFHVEIDGTEVPVDHIITLSRAFDPKYASQLIGHESAHAAIREASEAIKAGMKAALSPDELSAVLSHWGGEEGAAIAVQDYLATGRLTDPKTGLPATEQNWIQKIGSFFKNLSQMVFDRSGYVQRTQAEGAAKRMAEGEVLKSPEFGPGQGPAETPADRFAAEPRDLPETDVRSALVDQMPGLRNLPPELWPNLEESLQRSGVARQGKMGVDDYKSQLEKSFGFSPEYAAEIAKKGSRTPQETVYLNEVYDRIRTARHSAEEAYDQLLAAKGDRSQEVQAAKDKADKLFGYETTVLRAASHGASDIGRGLRLLQDVGDRRLEFKVRVRDIERQIGRPLSEPEYRTHEKLMEELNSRIDDAEMKHGKLGDLAQQKQEELAGLREEYRKIKANVGANRERLGKQHSAIRSGETKLERLEAQIRERSAALEEIRRQARNARRGTKVDPQVLKSPEVGDAVQKVLQHEGQLAKQSIWETAQQIRKLGLLSNPRTIIRNALSNAVQFARTEGLRPADAAFDWLIGLRTGKRTITANPFAGAFRGSTFEAAAQTWSEGKSILKMGATPDELARFELTSRSSGSKAVDAYVQVLQRFQNIQDLPWKRLAFSRSLREQAILMAKAVKGSKAADFLATPTEAMLTKAVADAELAVFSSPNKITQAIEKSVQGSPTAKFVVDQIMPFRKVPMNIGADIATANPAGAIANAIVYSNRIRAATLAGDTVAAEIAQKRLARLLTNGVLGTALLGYGFYLYTQRKMQGASPLSSGKRDMLSATGAQGPSIELFGKRFSVGGLHPFINVMAMGATIAEGLEDEARKLSQIQSKASEDDVELSPDDVPSHWTAWLRGFGQLLKDQPFYAGFQQLSSADEQNTWLKFAGQQMGSFIPTAVSDASQIVKPDALVRTPTNVQEALEQRLGMGKKLPPKITSLGETVKRSSVFDVTQAREAPKRGSVKGELVRLGVELPLSKRKLGEDNPPVDRQRYVGEQVNQALEEMVKGGGFSSRTRNFSRSSGFQIRRNPTLERVLDEAGYLPGKPYAEQPDEVKRIMLKVMISRASREASKDFQSERR